MHKLIYIEKKNKIDMDYLVYSNPSISVPKQTYLDTQAHLRDQMERFFNSKALKSVNGSLLES